MVGTAMNGLASIETIKSEGTEADFFTRVAGQHARALAAEQRLALSSNWLTLIPTVLGAVSTVAILGIGALRVMDGVLSVGMLVAFQSLAASFGAPVSKLLSLGGRLQEAAGDLRRLDDVLAHPLDETMGADAKAPPAKPEEPKLRGMLELRGVSFGYSRREPALIEDFDLTVRPGGRVALVGTSGSGKSTISKLVCGLHEPWQGEILFDGQPRASVPHAVLCNSMALVDQDIALFEGTVRENLSLWDPTVDETAMVGAARDAHIHDDIAARKGGYDSSVDEDGANFSGGQRQRLEIARALVGNPTILVLDEATSALDPITEQWIDDSLRRRGCTCLVIAHRLSTIRDCDEIVVLDHGRVVERGTHEQLMAMAGVYASLIEQ